MQFGTDPLSAASTPGSTLRVSTDSAGTEANASSGGTPFTSASATSGDGRYVVFESDATNLVAGDNNGAADIFVKDTQTGVTTRVSTDSAGNEANSSSFHKTISADGRYVAFTSYATNLVPGDTNGVWDVFVKDMQTGTTTRVSTDSAGGEGTSGFASSVPSISADGRYVAFQSEAGNLVAGDTNSASDIFVKDTQTGVTTRVSTDSTGTQSDGASFVPNISADGRYVAFQSLATNLVAGDTNGVYDIFLKDTQTGVTTRVSTDSAGTQAKGCQ